MSIISPTLCFASISFHGFVLHCFRPKLIRLLIRSISIISISAYGVFMIAPAILGLTADIFGLEMVFLPIIFLFIICFVLLIFNKKNIY